MAYSHTLLFSDILDKVHKAKTKVEKVEGEEKWQAVGMYLIYVES